MFSYENITTFFYFFFFFFLLRVCRSELFDHIASYFPEEMTHPRANLTSLIPYPMDLG